MALTESETTELKRTVSKDICKEIIAFANTRDGTVWIGVEDDGTPCGIEDADGAILRINNMVRDTVKPDLTAFVRYSRKELNGKTVLAVTVQKGTARPYWLADKGLKPAGVFVRNGTAADPATDSAIRRMIRESDGESYEELRSLEQELTFGAAAAEFEKCGLPLDAAKMRTLGLVSADGVYSNLAWLLSDQNPSTVKLAAFGGEDTEIFCDRREFSGSVFTQLDGILDYLSKANRLGAAFEGFRRVDRRDYPPAALREALLNFIIHRDYATRAASRISLFSNRIEFHSIGGLFSGMTLEDVMAGVSICRNPNLSRVFYRLDYVEAYGIGIRRIMDAYRGFPEKPRIEATPMAFKLILPNRGAEIGVQRKRLPLTPEESVLDLASRRGAFARSDVDELLGLTQTASSRLLRAMVEKGLLIRTGSGRSTAFAKPPRT